jgi:carbonic anhydrase/acetyltransferase-like protein (isoleucine patch superfamily)
MLRKLTCAVVVLLPWPMKRWILQRFFGYQIHPTARMGWSWFFPQQLQMGERSVIGHGNVAIHLERVELGVAATVGRGNWITGYAKNGPTHFKHQPDREPVLLIGDHAAITKNHHLDCTHRIRIGAFTTIAGYQSQFLTHSIDIIAGRQHSEPIDIGSYCFVGTDCTVLGGSVLPDRSVLGAKSLLNKSWTDTTHLYGGVPAHPIKALPEDAAYFHRKEGFVA